ncbi:uncharacterized protein LOC116167957 [Photinus pyralis]|uniref:uncharacterized protein LOC116167957 n=1 Tax=Photinus pyralis TaxID=7054 RepID=UPI00126736C2|nr:uncharacterized protein LOC116167957 [Photinus pyralis]
MKEFAEKYQFKHVTSAPYHQQGNGKAEAAVKIAKNLIKSEQSDEELWWVLLHHRNTPNKIGYSPVERLMSRPTRTGIPSNVSKYVPKVPEQVPALIEKHRRYNKYYYDKKGKDLPQLNIGEGVQVQLKPDTDKRWQPATVSRQLTERAYEIDTGGTKYVRDRVNLKDRATSIQDLEKEENLIHKEMRTSCIPKEQKIK